MAIPRKKVLEKLAGLRKGICYHLDQHIPALIGRADKGLVEYWRKEVAARIGEFRTWAQRLSKNEALLQEADDFHQQLSELLDERLRQLDD